MMKESTPKPSRFDTFDADEEAARAPGAADAPAEDAGLSGQEAHVRTAFWKKMARFAGRIPFAEDAVAAYYCALDPHTPARVRATLLAALAYFILPLDGIPDFLLGLGFSDDAAVLAAAVSMVARHITPLHRAAAARILQTGFADPDAADAAADADADAFTLDLEAEETPPAH
ncbi:MAG: hypothetical protein Kow0032_09690 [Methyloligellaceae bacterium]